MIFKNKNDYSVVIFRTGQSPFKVTYVHNLRKMLDYAERKYSGFKYMNVYNRRSSDYMGRVYKGQKYLVEPKPKGFFGVIK